jgi:hypothetical protein
MICSARRSSWICVSAARAISLAVGAAASGAVAAAAVALAFAVPSVVLAQAGGLEVRPADREQIASGPREVVATTFAVRNASGAPLEVEPRLVLPAGWSAITPETPFDLAISESSVRLVSFMIPESARAGEYPVTFEVRDRRQLSLSDSYTVRVQVTSAPKVQVIALEAPDFVIAGEPYRSAFLIRNVGNSPIVASFKVRNRRGLRAAPTEGTLALDPGESRQIEIEATAPEASAPTRQRSNARLTVAVSVEDVPTAVLADSVTQVVPRASPLDAFHTLGSRLDMHFVARDARGNRSSGWQPELSGAGVIDEEHERYLSFKFRGPDARDRGSLGASDEYWVRYQDPNVTAAAGDFTYSLSQLTDPGRFGRGALFGFERTLWGLTAFEMRDPYSSSVGVQRGLNAYYRLNNTTQLDANLLDRTEGTLPADILSLRAQSQWDLGFTTDLEVGQSDGGGERGNAVRAALHDSRRAVRYYILGWSADEDFRGYLRDKEYLSAGFDYPRAKGFGLRGYYRLQNWNLEPLEEIDPDLLDRRNEADFMLAAPTERQWSLGTSRSLLSGTRASLDYTHRTRVGGTTSPDIDLVNQSWRAGLGQSWRVFSLNYSYERGATLNNLSGAQFDTSAHLFSASLRAGRHQSYGLYALHDESSNANEPENARTSYGMNASYRFGTATSLTLDAQRGETRFGRTAQYNLSFTHERPTGARFRLAARRLEGRFARTDLLASYSIPFSLPVLRKAGVSTVRGRVYDEDSGDGLRNVLLHLDGLTAVTNGKGEFEFPAVKAGHYRLAMDRRNIAVDRIPAASSPLDVTVDARVPDSMQIALVRAVTIAVAVKLHSDDATPSRGAPNQLVVFRSGEAVLRRLTDAEGRVRLGGLAPGKWIVTVAEDTLPPGYAAAVGDLELEVGAGESVNADIPLTPVKRNIRMLAPLGIARIE